MERSRPSSSEATGAALALFLLCQWQAPVALSAEDLSRPNLDHAWFKPSLTVNTDPICDSLEADVQQAFGTSTSWHSYHSSTLSIEQVADDPGALTLQQPDGKKLYLYRIRNPGCGGACETEQRAVSEVEITPRPNFGQDGLLTTPASVEWSVYSSTDQQLLIGMVDDSLELYRIGGPQRLQLACRIPLAPPRLETSENPAIQQALGAVNQLAAAADRMAGGEGNCGSSHTASRWQGYRREALREALYRPWAIANPEASYPVSENSYTDYSRIEPSLQHWALGGIAEHSIFLEYQAQLAQATSTLSHFYVQQFGWREELAATMAHEALTNAISRGFGFYMYDSDTTSPAARLRSAILEHAPIATIQSTPLNPNVFRQADSDSILNVAVGYPLALEYLLKQGVGPNEANAFGKTPLMYAVQQNQLDSVRLLLKANADPNAATTAPNDTCSYTLETVGMTPLHYAARFASGEIIRALVDAGAVTFLAASSPSQLHAYPLDWLHRYSPAGSGKDARNPNLSKDDTAGLEATLRVPGEDVLRTLAVTLTTRAQSAYRRGDIDGAYRTLRLALAADPNNATARSDMPLIALKAGKVGPSLAAADIVLATANSPAALAAAWFNKGLACSQVEEPSIAYNGETYCMGDRLLSFVRAWTLEPTPARADKLRSMLNVTGQGVCTVWNEKAQARDNYVFALDYGYDKPGSKQVQRIYALQPSGKVIDPEEIRYSVKYYGGATAIVSPQVVARHELAGQTLTILESDYFGSPPTIHGSPCDKSAILWH